LAGIATLTNNLTTAANIALTGAVTGNVGFDGTKDVNIEVEFSNVYINNSTVYGDWSNVTVNDMGQVINVGNIEYNDIINALGYIPFNSANITSNLITDTVVMRDAYGNFNANIMVGTAVYTNSLVSNIQLSLIGQAIGESNVSNYNNNVIIQSNLIISSNVTPGIYNTLVVDDTGITQIAKFIDNMPIGSIVLYSQNYIPPGWAACNGELIQLPNGYSVQMPSMSNAIVGFVNADAYFGSITADVCGVPLSPIQSNAISSGINNVYVNNSNANIEVVWTSQIGAIYIMHIYEDVLITSGVSNSGVMSANLSAQYIPELILNGGANIIYPPLNYSGNIQPPFTAQSEQIVYNFVESNNFNNNQFYDAVALLLSAGDTNAVMMCAIDIFGDLSQLVVQQVLYNLQNRHTQGLPPRLGKYMLSQQDIINYMSLLELPIDTTFFTIALQDEIMLLKISDITNKYVAASLYPDDSKLFGAVYIGYPQYIAILQAPDTSTVGSALVTAGFSITGDSYTDNLSCSDFISAIQTMISTAENTIIQNKTSISIITQLNSITNQNYTVPTSLIQQPDNIIGNVYTESNLTMITIDGISNYYGGNITISPTLGFGGGAFPYSSVISSTQYYTDIAQSRYLNAIVTKTNKGTLLPSMLTGIGIDIGDIANTNIGNLSTTSGVVNIVVGPVDSPQPTQEILQNSLISNRQLSGSTALQNSISTTVYPGTNQTKIETITQLITQTTPISTTQNVTISNVITSTSLMTNNIANLIIS
jgi:hypothetical protein